ncbi:MAG: hypothetical protein ACRDTC_03490 [Pseudonocardiaceae bacterium]
MSSGGVRVLAAVVGAVCVVVVYFLAYLLVGEHGGHAQLGSAATAVVSPAPTAGGEYHS